MANELYLLKIHGNHSGQHSEVGLAMAGSNLTANSVFENATDLVAEFNSQALGPWLEMFPVSYEVERLSARRIKPTGGVEITREYQDGEQQGQVTGGAASNQLCPVVRLIPPMGTKSAGKFFLPCIAESDINANAVQPAWTTRLGTLMSVLLSNFGGGSIQWQLAVYSRTLDTYVNAMSYDTSGTVGFQRRRARPY